jgi:uncharacterized protein involved in outer membrane biogenesis
LRAFAYRHRGPLVVSALVVLVIGVVWVALAATLFDEDWVKGKIRETVKAKYDAEVTIGSLELDIWRGRFAADSVAVERDDERSTARARIRRVEADLSVLALLFGSIEIERLELHEPLVSAEVTRKPEGPPQAPMDRLADLIARAVYEVVYRPLIRSIEDILAILCGDRRVPVHLGKVVVHDGDVTLVVRRENTVPLTVHLSEIDYEACDIDVAAPLDLVRNAVVSLQFTIGDAAGAIETQFARDPKAFSLKGLDLGQSDRLFSQNDLLVLKGGTLDVGAAISDDYAKI